jgi:hypothetical protein
MSGMSFKSDLSPLRGEASLPSSVLSAPLDEALEASLLMFVVDASNSTYESQLEVSRSVLREIGADVVPARLIRFREVA